ncbi:hypothetical protein JO972_00900 [Verrucomicrobiaceae bacterium 5K15]|uniref:Transmembrane protein n=1 Tax=Oceaniferula flava TaxID=2800421 RepID=A0AAE2S9G8_9BACT|nr:hypothetical protein [Oceaniferula flavus]MBK1853508.1 hypothetical protein [Oceaniferula flavus]MBM1134813.1 hypothetical protein [Oceaniferula flavus]
MDDLSHTPSPPESSALPSSAPPSGLHIPPQPPAGMPGQAPDAQDVEHIRILSICYYVMAGLTALLACVPIFHLLVGVMMLTGGFGSSTVSPQEKESMQMAGALFTGVATLIILSGWVIALLNFLVARRIVRRESRLLCLVVAGINCLNMPMGTVLGVFTFIVLNRPQVIQSFDARQRST